jgi:hypothetical protein
MDKLIMIGQGLILATIVAFGSYILYILCLFFIKLTDIIKGFTESLENKLFNSEED